MRKWQGYKGAEEGERVRRGKGCMEKGSLRKGSMEVGVGVRGVWGRGT